MIKETLDILYINSTTPAQLIKTISKNNKIICYLFDNKNLANSFRIFKNKENNNFIILPKNNFLRFIKLLIILLLLKVKKKKIFFFFECNNFQFDFLINIINCKGYFCPFDLAYKTTMIKIDSFLKIDKINLFKKIYYVILYHIGQKKMNFYYRNKFNGIAIYTINSKYPKNIKELNYKKFLLSKKKIIIKKKIIFILQKILDDNAVLDFQNKFNNEFLELKEFLKNKGFEIHIKDHPNKINRLNIDSHGLKVLDPNIPCEFLEDDYFLAIGFMSNPLLNFYYGRAVSMIDIFKDCYSTSTKELYERYIKSWSSHFDIDIFRPQNIDDLKNYINKKLKTNE